MQLKMFNHHGKPTWFPELVKHNSFTEGNATNFLITIGNHLLHSREKLDLRNTNFKIASKEVGAEGTSLKVVKKEIFSTKENDGKFLGIFQLLPDFYYRYNFSSLSNIFVEIDECKDAAVIEILKREDFYEDPKNQKKILSALQMYLLAHFTSSEGYIKVRIMKKPNYWFIEPKETDYVTLDSLTLTLKSVLFLFKN